MLLFLVVSLLCLTISPRLVDPFGKDAFLSFFFPVTDSVPHPTQAMTRWEGSIS